MVTNPREPQPATEPDMPDDEREERVVDPDTPTEWDEGNEGNDEPGELDDEVGEDNEQV
jgi:hypothetical protein